MTTNNPSGDLERVSVPEDQKPTLDIVREGASHEWAVALLEKRRVELVRHHDRFPFTIDKSMAETAIAIETVLSALAAPPPARVTREEVARVIGEWTDPSDFVEDPLRVADAIFALLKPRQ